MNKYISPSIKVITVHHHHIQSGSRDSIDVSTDTEDTLNGDDALGRERHSIWDNM